MHIFHVQHPPFPLLFGQNCEIILLNLIDNAWQPIYF